MFRARRTKAHEIVTFITTCHSHWALRPADPAFALPFVVTSSRWDIVSGCVPPFGSVSLKLFYCTVGGLMTSALPPEEEPQQNGRRHPNTALSDAIDKIEPKKRYPTGPIGPYHHAARWIARSEDPFVSFNRIFSLALGKDDEDEDDMEDDGDSELQVNNPYNRTKEEDRAHHLQMYKILRHRVPSVKDALITFGEERSGRMVALACYMAGVVSGARSDDIKGLKMVGLGYVAVFPGKSLGPEVLISPNKEETRGWNDPIISELLCPIEHLDTFRMDPEGTRRKFQDGVIELTADQAAPYMYLHADPDPAHPYEGLFRSELIKKTWRHIYQSPSSAAANRAINVRRGEGDSKKPQTVTPATIAYATMHTYWFLCACSDWRSPEGSGAQAIVFMAVLKIFQMRGMETWAKETLEEWNE
ncbi:hypothetical protein BC834DRAFT_360583 [Gloeopeniophorella convolvens]|nr:hypothetical protein BC834DRAFT_360583 [Gloeopeniophorella convolvens]